MPHLQFAKSESSGSEANISFSTAQRKEAVFRFSTSDVETAETRYMLSSRCLRKTHNMLLYLKYAVKNALSFSNGMMSILIVKVSVDLHRG